jgi:outer membrane biogenesis lipoprotein LolB
MKKTLGMLLLLCVVLPGCGNNSSSGPNLTGSWQFTVTSSANGNTYNGSASITQSSTSVSGTVTFSNDPCATAAPLAGSISGTSLSLQVTEGTQVVDLTGTVNSGSTAMSGTYSAPSGGCTEGDFGSWAASKS